MTAENIKGQGRFIFDMASGSVSGITYIGQREKSKVPEITKNITSEHTKPSLAYMNGENLDIIRDRVLARRLLLDISSHEALAKGLVVFRRGTKIQLSPKEELMRGYSINLNISIIACPTSILENDLDTPIGRNDYQILGVFNEFKGTGRVSTDKATRDYITIQRSDIAHPQSLAIYECFFANPSDSIKVKESRFGKTSFWYKK